MSAPKTRDPLAVTTRDGMSWVRRAVTQDGRGLYAPEGVCNCPEFVMATLVELAEHGIRGRDPLADAVAAMGALPVPVGPESQTPMTAHAASVRLGQYGARPKTWSTATYDSGAEKALHEIAVALDTEVKRLRARVAELESAAGDGSTRTADEDPIAYSLTVEALHASSGAVIETPSRREQSTAKLRGILARQQAAVEAAHETPPRPRPTPHDLPEVTP